MHIHRTWTGEYWFALSNLIKKDFRVRYRNMSLGILWSLVNPIVMMGVLTFVFTKVFPNEAVKGNFGLFVLCGLLPFNFFSIAWSSSTTSLLDNMNLVKRVAIPRELFPIAAVLGNCVHLAIQIVLLLAVACLVGPGPNLYWLWLPVVLVLEVILISGLGLIFSALDVFIRDMRYVVESTTTVLFWLVPVIYPFSVIAPEYREIYLYNPIAALVMAVRNIILESQAPAASLLIKLFLSSFLLLGLGFVCFRRLQRRFYEYL